MYSVGMPKVSGKVVSGKGEIVIYANIKGLGKIRGAVPVTF